MLTYLAITVGPVDKTLQKAKTTREFWVASFFLSKLMEIIIKHEYLNRYLLSPQQVIGDTNGAGVYPDRAYWKLDIPLTGDEIKNINNSILEKLSEETSDLISAIDLKNYLKMYWVQASWSVEELENESFLFRINELLDGIELQEKWEQNKPIELMELLIAKGIKKGLQRPVYKWRKESTQGGLYPYVSKADNENVERFPSISEICTRCFLEADPEWYTNNIIVEVSSKLSELEDIDRNTSLTNDKKKELQAVIGDENLMSKIKNKFNKIDKTIKFLSRHKYICIIQSDGDGVGSFLQNNVKNDVNKLKNFSNQLNDFIVQATHEVKDYGGIPVYAGGDDLLFFAPLKDKNEKNTIIHLLQKLDLDFKLRFPESSMSLSFGVSITYFKFPLSESLVTTVKQLRKVAKNEPLKNYISVQLQKHSGQLISFGFNLANESYEYFIKLLDNTLFIKESFLNSVMYKLDDQLEIIEKIGLSHEKICLFFDNNFNESKHKDYKNYFDLLAHYIRETFDFYQHESIEQKINRIYGSLRFIQFLNTKDKDNE